METREWILKRNCSIAPRRLAWFIAMPHAVLPVVAPVFIVHDASVVQIGVLTIFVLIFILFFSVIEFLADSVAGRRASAQQRIN